ncbi:glucuronidase 2 [Perilla frutescens var. hirtella]|nr:glucuronidase 2 [Perilla frutescens var. hirtella]KAH6807734.1 glucuronidase 2 [Perilla frutescens var. frutescens]
MGFQALFLVFLAFCPAILAQKSEDARLVINTSSTVAETDASYICATIDWWPQDKCNYNRCPWGSSSVLNLDLSHPFLINAILAFKNLRIRVGGSLQDQVIYDVGNSTSSCQPFRKQKGGLFGFSKGCLPMRRWGELNNFFRKTGVVLTFGLNALYGRHQVQRGVWGGDWDSSNARDFIRYTISNGYNVDSWEFGNELSGKGVGASVGAEKYGKDLIRLSTMIDELYANHLPKPVVLAPGGFYDKSWFDTVLQVSGPYVVNVLSHHMYTLGPGNDPNIMKKILNPDHLNKASFVFGNLTSTILANGPWALAWVGESGGAFNNGARGISNAFVNSFWYLDQLGMAAKYNTRVYCRQTLIGGFYGLLNKTTFVPSPDYYSALLWHRLMGKGVLAVNSYASPYLRVYAHCAKERAGVVVVLINLSNQTVFNVEVESSYKAQVQVNKKRSFAHRLKRSVSWIGNKGSDEKLSREEYHLTPRNGDLRSTTVLLNGQALQLTEGGGIPDLVPGHVDANSPLSIAPLSIKFVVYPNFNAPGCK